MLGPSRYSLLEKCSLGFFMPDADISFCQTDSNKVPKEHIKFIEWNELN